MFRKMWAGTRPPVIGAFDGVPDDTLPGDGTYSLPVETLTTGLISVQ
jgi:hypothetical protein